MSIKIKKSKQGSLHTHLGVPQGKKIPASKLKIKSTDSSAIKKKKQFAINAKKWKHEDGGLVPEYSWGGVLADTAAGAGTGALLGGPVGAVIGGAGAFLKGAFGEVQGNREEQLKLSQQKVANATNSFNTMMMGSNQNPFTQMMAKGGMVSMNAEIEKGETAVSPDGRMREFSLPSHANAMGDNFKYFDPGTMIFSDKLKFNKNKTFAQEQLSYKKISDKAEKALKNPGSTFLNKKTAGLNKQNSLKMTFDLFGKQEAMKMSKGGSVPGKYWGGGKTPQYNLGYSGFGSEGNVWPEGINNIANFQIPQFSRYSEFMSGVAKSGTSQSNPTAYGLKTAGFDNSSFRDTNILGNPMNLNPAVPSLNQYGTTGFNPVTDASKAAVGQNIAKTPGVVNPDSEGPDWGGIGMQALALAPDIYNLGHALFSKPEKVERNRYFNPYTNQIRSRMNDRRFNIDPILAGNRTANAVYNRNAASASGGDRSRLLSNLMGGLNARYGADAAAYAQKNNMDNQYLGQQAEMDMNLGNMNARGLMMSDDINAQNMAAKRNFGASAASGLQSYALNQMQMQNQMNSQNAYLDVLQRVNPFFNQWMGIDDLRSYNKKR